ncbi:MAG: hypothetical protein HYW25_03725 [Candidatus Aenigmarchaeota archaeon]|nr:hypothetical protein [Candidatus Aenigmarchaeota archaeon]
MNLYFYCLTIIPMPANDYGLRSCADGSHGILLVDTSVLALGLLRHARNASYQEMFRAYSREFAAFLEEETRARTIAPVVGEVRKIAGRLKDSPLYDDFMRIVGIVERRSLGNPVKADYFAGTYLFESTYDLSPTDQQFVCTAFSAAESRRYPAGVFSNDREMLDAAVHAADQSARELGVQVDCFSQRSQRKLGGMLGESREKRRGRPHKQDRLDSGIGRERKIIDIEREIFRPRKFRKWVHSRDKCMVCYEKAAREEHEASAE